MSLCRYWACNGRVRCHLCLYTGCNWKVHNMCKLKTYWWDKWTSHQWRKYRSISNRKHRSISNRCELGVLSQSTASDCNLRPTRYDHCWVVNLINCDANGQITAYSHYPFFNECPVAIHFKLICSHYLVPWWTTVTADHPSTDKPTLQTHWTCSCYS